MDIITGEKSYLLTDGVLPCDVKRNDDVAAPSLGRSTAANKGGGDYERRK